MTGSEADGSATVGVHWVPVDIRAAEHFGSMVSEVERTRAARYRQPADRWRSIIAAGALRWVVGQDLGIAPAEVAIERACSWCGEPHGRPAVTGADLHVSLAHAGDWVLVAATRVAPVGVDVEQVISARGLPLPRDLILGPAERAAGDDELLDLWVAKESYLKALGTGLTLQPCEVSVLGSRITLPGRPEGRLVRLVNRPGYLAAVCVTGDLAPDVEEAELSVPQGS